MAGQPNKSKAKDGIAQKGAHVSQSSVEIANEKVAKELARRKRVVRNYPASPFEEPLEFAKQIFEFGSGEPVRRLTLFDHLSKAPERRKPPAYNKRK